MCVSVLCGTKCNPSLLRCIKSQVTTATICHFAKRKKKDSSEITGEGKVESEVRQLIKYLIISLIVDYWLKVNSVNFREKY